MHQKHPQSGVSLHSAILERSLLLFKEQARRTPKKATGFAILYETKWVGMIKLFPLRSVLREIHFANFSWIPNLIPGTLHGKFATLKK